MKAASLTLFATLIGGTASAHTGAARLVIDNDVDATVNVFVDGRALGSIFPNGERTFTVDTGWHRVEVRRNGDVLLTEWTELGRRDADFFRVRPSFGTVLVANAGRQPLFLDGDGRSNDVWILGGDTARLQIDPGLHTFKASVWTHHGLDVRDVETVFVSANGERRFALNIDPTPLRGTVWVRNSEAHDVLVYADGRYLGAIDAFGTRSFLVDAGAVHLVARTRSGSTLYDTRVAVGRDADARIVVHRAVPTPSTRVVHVPTPSTRVW